jgi:hypothetical protein
MAGYKPALLGGLRPVLPQPGAAIHRAFFLPIWWIFVDMSGLQWYKQAPNYAEIYQSWN